MFTKLLKQEWRATRGILGVLCLICLSAALLGGGAMRFLVKVSSDAEEQNLLVVLCVLTMIASILAIAVCLVASLFLSIWRFYKSRFTDEGYLTFTLPVTAHQIVLSSMANSAIVIVLATFTGIAGYGVLFLLGISGVEGFWPALWEVSPRLLQLLREALASIQPGHVILSVLSFLVGFACELVILMLAVTTGAVIAKKHKILAAIGVYYGINMVLSVVSTVSMLTLASGSQSELLTRFLGTSGLLGLAITAGGYFLMYYLIDKKLNLN